MIRACELLMIRPASWREVSSLREELYHRLQLLSRAIFFCTTILCARKIKLWITKNIFEIIFQKYFFVFIVLPHCLRLFFKNFWKIILYHVLQKIFLEYFTTTKKSACGFFCCCWCSTLLASVRAPNKRSVWVQALANRVDHYLYARVYRTDNKCQDLLAL